jgi:uncharacterized RDD family membrane protein YckC
MSAPVLPARPAGRLVTADTLAVAPAVLGRPLAEPWRRFAAMVVDLVVVALLSLLSGPWLGFATGGLLLVLFGNSPTAPVALKVVRTVCRALGALLAVLSVLALGHVSLVRDQALNLDAFTGREASPALRETVFVAPDARAAELREATDQLQRQVEALKAEVRDWQQASSSWQYQARTFTNALGVTFGWSGAYFTLVAGYFGGRTLGKRLFRTRTVKINGQPFTFLDAFIRHGGYVAGVAMGFMGFLKLLWDPNRQTVEDRVASTVVVKD